MGAKSSVDTAALERTVRDAGARGDEPTAFDVVARAQRWHVDAHLPDTRDDAAASGPVSCHTTWRSARSCGAGPGATTSARTTSRTNSAPVSGCGAPRAASRNSSRTRSKSDPGCTVPSGSRPTRLQRMAVAARSAGTTQYRRLLRSPRDRARRARGRTSPSSRCRTASSRYEPSRFGPMPSSEKAITVVVGPGAGDDLRHCVHRCRGTRRARTRSSPHAS